jgi:uncharacterized protein
VTARGRTIGPQCIKVRPMPSRSTEVRDPIHGGIAVSKDELRILDHRLFQRLRHIRQLGFSDLSFPGATHTRYLHSVGAMHLAGKAFDSVFMDSTLPDISPARISELRQLVRAAALVHDIGHAPFSHATEFAMPDLRDLEVGAYADRPDLYPPARQATHEDYTIKIVTDSSLTPLIEQGLGVPALAVAGLVDPDLPSDPDWYEACGIDFRPLLQQLISSELDVDRMDYLQRDSHYAGVHYGVFDHSWLMNSLAAHLVEGRACLALSDRAIYAFDDFLIARYHMFLNVYFHYRSVSYEEMLKRYFRSGGDGWRIPADVEAYAEFDDHELTQHLRASDNEWARRIVDRREYKLLLERHGNPDAVDLSRVLVRLAEGGVPTITAASRGVLSKYFRERDAAVDAQGKLPLGPHQTASPRPASAIYVLERPYRGAPTRRARALEQSTALFERYAQHLMMSRVYVPEEFVAEAGALVDGIA